MLNYNMKKLCVIKPTKYQLVFYPKHNNYLRPETTIKYLFNRILSIK